MKKHPLISIVINNYNGLEYLKETLKGLKNLNYPNYEIIVVDNNSTDKSRIFIESKGIKLVKNKINGAKNRGYNLGIKKSKGDFVLFLDCDVLVNDKDLLNKLLKMYRSSETIGILSLALINKGEEKVYFYGEFLSYLSLIKRNRRLSLNEAKQINGFQVAGIQGASFFVSKKVLKKIGFFDELISFGGDDVDLGIRSIMNGYVNKIFSQSIQTHIGIKERVERSRYRRKFFSSNLGLYLTIIKNYNLRNVILSLSLFLPYNFLKAVKDSAIYKDPKLVFDFFRIIYFLIKNFKIIVTKRHIIQNKRIVKEDLFLNIKPPELSLKLKLKVFIAIIKRLYTTFFGGHYR